MKRFRREKSIYCIVRDAGVVVYTLHICTEVRLMHEHIEPKIDEVLQAVSKQNIAVVLETVMARGYLSSSPRRTGS